jgi:hypothetical protein
VALQASFRLKIRAHIVMQDTTFLHATKKNSSQALLNGLASKLQIENLNSHFDARHTNPILKFKKNLKTNLAQRPCKQASD